MELVVGRSSIVTGLRRNLSGSDDMCDRLGEELFFRLLQSQYANSHKGGGIIPLPGR